MLMLFNISIKVSHEPKIVANTEKSEQKCDI